MAVSDSRWVFLVLVNLLLLVAGCFLNATAILVVIVPILLPISKEPLERVIRPLVPLLLVMVAMLAVVRFIPEITLFVPRLLYGK